MFLSKRDIEMWYSKADSTDNLSISEYKSIGLALDMIKHNSINKCTNKEWICYIENKSIPNYSPEITNTYRYFI